MLRFPEGLVELRPTPVAAEKSAYEACAADRGLIRAGLVAEVKLTAYEFLGYGSLYGEISHVASDTSFDEAMGLYCRVVVTTE